MSNDRKVIGLFYKIVMLLAGIVMTISFATFIFTAYIYYSTFIADSSTASSFNISLIGMQSGPSSSFGLLSIKTYIFKVFAVFLASLATMIFIKKRKK